jgi:hypothetical protein
MDKKATVALYEEIVRRFEDKASRGQPDHFGSDASFTSDVVALSCAVYESFSATAFEHFKAVDAFFAQHSVEPNRMSEFQRLVAVAREALKAELA